MRVIKKALIEHLDMDPVTTLSVLCDQIQPVEDLDEEEQATRDRLRSLVLAFLTQEAHRAVTERHAVRDSEAESVLVRGILQVRQLSFQPRIFSHLHTRLFLLCLIPISPWL